MKIGSFISFLLTLYLCASWSVQSRELLAVGTNFSQIFEETKDGKLEGYAVELINTLARKQGDTVKFLMFPWARAQLMVSSGKADILIGPYKTPERKISLTFLDQPFYQDRMVFYKLKASKFAWDGNYDSLKDKRITTILGWVYGEPFNTKRSMLNISAALNIENGLKMLLAQRTDLLAANERNSASFLNTPKFKNNIVSVSPPIGYEAGYIAFPKDNEHAELAKKYNKAFKELIDTGKLAELAMKYGVRR
jgi:polar amino acid transport system substrate-binding protein